MVVVVLCVIQALKDRDSDILKMRYVLGCNLGCFWPPFLVRRFETGGGNEVIRELKRR